MNFHRIQRLVEQPAGRPINPFGGNPHVTRLLNDAGAPVALDLMSKAEFDPGPVAQAGFRMMNVASGLRVVTRQLVLPARTEDVHFVCTDEQVETTLPAWDRWAAEPQTIAPTAFFPDRPEDLRDVRRPEAVVGWWALDADVVWTRDGELAENIRGAFVTIAAGAVEASQRPTAD